MIGADAQVAPSGSDTGTMKHASAYAAYRSAEVATISQRELIVKLYAGAERFLAVAQESFASGQREAAHTACVKARSIFVELLSTLNLEQGGEIAVKLQALYTFFISRISQANLEQQPGMLAEIQPIIADLRGSWEQIPDEFANVSSVAASDGHAFSLRT